MSFFSLYEKYAENRTSGHLDLTVEPMDIMDELHLSHSGLWAKKYLTETLKCQVMCLDKGDDAGEASKTEDPEPLPAALDPWAQGCLPIVHFTHEFANMSLQEDQSDSHQVQIRSSWPVGKRLTSSLLSINEKGTAPLGDSSGKPSPTGCTQPQEVQTSQVQVQIVSSEKNSSNASKLCLTNSSLPIEKQKTTKAHREKQHHSISQCSPQKLSQNKKQGANLSPKADAHKLLPPISHSSERKDVEVKRKSVEQAFLQHKNVSGSYLKKSKTRLEPSCLPQKWICPQYEIVENIHPKQKPCKETRDESKLSKHTNWMTASRKPLTGSRNQVEKINKNTLDCDPLSKHEKEPNMTSNLVRSNKTLLAKGVSFIDSQGVEVNSQTCKHQPEPSKLKPIQNHPAVPLFSVEQVTKASPQVTPLFQSQKVTSANNK